LAGVVQSGSSWFRIRTSGGLLWIRWCNFGFWRHGVSHVYKHILIQYMYIVSALGPRGLFSSRTPMEHHAHSTLGTSALSHWESFVKLSPDVDCDEGAQSKM
jgi:hypothetical protein